MNQNSPTQGQGKISQATSRYNQTSRQQDSRSCVERPEIDQSERALERFRDGKLSSCKVISVSSKRKRRPGLASVTIENQAKRKFIDQGRAGGTDHFVYVSLHLLWRDAAVLLKELATSKRQAGANR